MTTDETLNERLAREGWSTRPGRSPGCKDILKGSTVCLTDADAAEVWAWLRGGISEVRLIAAVVALCAELRAFLDETIRIAVDEPTAAAARAAIAAAEGREVAP